MAELDLKKIRPLGKLEEVAAVAHHIDFFTNTGLSVHYRPSQPAPNLPEVIYHAVADVVGAHPILFAVPVGAGRTQEPYWGRLPSIDIKKAVTFVERSTPSGTDSEGRDKELDALLENQHNTNFKSGYGTLPVWRMVIVRDPGVNHEFTACLIAHHSMSDGTGLQVFHNSFQSALSDASSSSSRLSEAAEHVVFSNADDPIAPSLEQVHPLPVPAEPPAADATGIMDWTGTPVQAPCKTRYLSLSLAPHLAQSFAQDCKKHKATPATALPSLIARLLFHHLPPPTPEALLCNIPVSLRPDLAPNVVEGVMGNFIDAFKVKLLRADLDKPEDSVAQRVNSWDIWTHARKIQQGTRRYYANASPSGQPYTNIAFFKLIPDLNAALTATLGNARGESFEVSNLGTFSQPKNLKEGSGSPVWQAGKVTISRCAYAAGGPLVVCVLGSDENLGFGFTWQEGAIPDDVVDKVVNGVRMCLDPSQAAVS
ncbi:hypothetical protein G647_01828 [Cladophialophora carrionii CBS 160.54]|uniref:Alcohol acetyltransferase n=1 Tax=Cladophialophora carrionii CBS 160.54 TaxID=1279043 RepID=V9DR53_9EURO|nr:uncharacterized protein G647_01828 [Cladophialophora carrionii CBS 160.54]ETI29375.1 hypothetical protein G647_01828 [Cladophialophora carrionii CBS 160.54]